MGTLMGSLLCYLSPVGCASTFIAKATLGDFFSALTSWVMGAVSCLLTSAGGVLTSASEPSTVVGSANQEFDVLVTLAPALMLLGLLVATLQALRHSDAGSLWRVYLGVAPASVAAIVLARPLASLILRAVNQLSSSAASTVASHEASLARDLTNVAGVTPGFGLFLLAIGVVVGCWLLWCELIVRTVLLTLLLVLVPVIAPLATFPALRRIGWRLAETFLAVAVSKFLIVITLSLGLDEIMGSSATRVLSGAVTLLLATASPFLLLRVIPFVEQSALHQVEGVRQRFAHGVRGVSSSPVGMAARALVPEATLPEPEGRPEDLGLPMWPADGEVELPPRDGDALPAPVGTPTPRGGHVAYYHDDIGPVVGWHFDE